MESMNRSGLLTLMVLMCSGMFAAESVASVWDSARSGTSRTSTGPS